MKVAHLLRKYDASEWGGTETALLGLCEGLQHQSIESVVYGPRVAAAPRSDPLTDRGIRVERFSATLPIFGLSAAQRRQMTSIGGNLMSFELIRQLWSEPELAVVHAHTAGRIGAIGRTIARARGLPFVVTLHGGVYDLPPTLERSYVANGKGWEWGKLCGLVLRSRQLLSDADAVITGNAKAAELIRERHPAQRVLVQPHGVNRRLYAEDHRCDAWRAFPEVQDREVLLCLGRIDPAKNQSWLLEHLPELIRRHPQLLLVLAGAPTDYRYAGQIDRRIEQLGLKRHVIQTGGLPPADHRLVGLTQLARAVVLPSLAETFGLVILEAWAAGTPILSSRTAGASSLIEPGKTGLLFELNDGVTFHESIDQLWHGDPATRSLVVQARQRVTAFDTDTLSEQIARLYSELIEKKSAPKSGQVPRSERLQPYPAKPLINPENVVS